MRSNAPIPKRSRVSLSRDSTSYPSQTNLIKEVKRNKLAKKNANLHKAKQAKNDEFYTRYEDIEKEISHYWPNLKGKWVYSPCDDYRWSEFKNYFVQNFSAIGLSHYTCTNYDLGDGAYRYDYDGETETIAPLEGNGDFRREECTKIKDEADIVVTNPPFSLFRPFVEQIMTMGKKFLIIGNKNAITYKEIFPYLKDNKMWLGYNHPHYFEVPLDEVENEKIQYEEGGKIYQTFGNICWFTNLEHSKRKEYIGLTKKYNPTDYPKYDNFDAIEVSKVTDIPKDYDGVMGVPITYLDKHNPNQFEILGCTERWSEFRTKKYTIDQYASANDLNATWVVLNNNTPKTGYKRLLIRKVKELPTEEEVKNIAE